MQISRGSIGAQAYQRRTVNGTTRIFLPARSNPPAPQYLSEMDIRGHTPVTECGDPLGLAVSHSLVSLRLELERLADDEHTHMETQSSTQPSIGLGSPARKESPAAPDAFASVVLYSSDIRDSQSGAWSGRDRRGSQERQKNPLRQSARTSLHRTAKLLPKT